MSVRFGSVLRALFVVAAIHSAGCGSKKEAGDTLSGKVTLGGQAVSGELVFVLSDKTERLTMIGEGGQYSIANLPKGAAQILVRKAGGGVAGLPLPKGVEAPPLPGATGTAPPAKYAQAGNGLSVNVVGGDQKHDIELK